MNPPKVSSDFSSTKKYFNIYFKILPYKCLLHTKAYHDIDWIPFHDGSKSVHFFRVSNSISIYTLLNKKAVELNTKEVRN